MNKNFIGKKCVVRCDRSGVFFGEIVEIDGRNVVLNNYRKLYYWEGACAVEQIAQDGVLKPENCKFTVWVECGSVTDAIQIIPCTDKAIKIIEGVKEWKI